MQQRSRIGHTLQQHELAKPMSRHERQNEGPLPSSAAAIGLRDANSFRGRLAAIGLLIVAVALFSLLDTVAKLLVSRYHLPVTEVIWLRFVGQTFYMILIFGIVGLPALLATKRLPLQLFRSCLMIVTTACNFIALQTLRLDQTITIVFLAPLVVAALAGPLLGEWVGWRRGVAIAVGFMGVIVAMHPGAAPLSFAVAASLMGMFAYALFMIVTRHLSAFDGPYTTLFYSMFVGTLFGAPLALHDWVTPPDITTWALLAALGALGGAGHMAFIFAYRLAPASTISPFLYVQLLFMVASGYFVFGDMPDRWTLTGATIIIASGIYLVHRERKSHKSPLQKSKSA
jgi:drug/metabolite transporter (DMT)-like permease